MLTPLANLWVEPSSSVMVCLIMSTDFTFPVAVTAGPAAKAKVAAPKTLIAATAPSSLRIDFSLLCRFARGVARRRKSNLRGARTAILWRSAFALVPARQRHERDDLAA